MSFSMIAAIGLSNELGLDNHLLCHLPLDLNHFKTKTIGKIVIMGSNTYRSISHPLKDRKNIVLTRDINLEIEGVETHSDYKSLIKKYQSLEEEIMIIGGAQIYRLFLPFTDKLYLTKIQSNFKANVYFPDYSQFNNCISSKRAFDNGFDLDFVEYTR